MRRHEGMFLLAALLSAGAYLLFSIASGGAGFPLDDAWIHQVYARNLGTRGEFAFFPGQPSAGSTAPLWSLLLAIGYTLRLDFRVWTFLLGIGLLGASAILAARLVRRLEPSSRFTVHCALFIVFEWHLVWSAVSGMEILLFVFLALLLLERFYARERAWVLGVLAGLLTLTRPEGVVLAALVFLAMLAERRFTAWGGGLLGLGICLAPYLAFNLATSGAIFPNTFYAKSAEYAVLFERVPFLARWATLLLVPFIGAQILLVPGLLYIVGALARKRAWSALLPVAWILLLPMLYALRLPVAYQHGRYEMPIIPFIVLYGIWGTGALLARVRFFVLRATWTVSIGAALLIFWLLGARQYATDVAIVDCEMVQTARWVAAHAPADAVVAAHDIGALGYYYPKPVIDLAGLVSPEVIPFIRDETRLREYLEARGATFVIVFPGWYPAFDADAQFVSVYRTDCAVTRAAGERNMVVYRIASERVR